ncbi:uncharacterized protein C19orf44 homolog isoform X2 [Periophthalmus magnuspinnatus]|uniref:uncharacterized protein C19orf44 homolog isoform X2 n=1 Tax=Periophthalmus magnuspinnatus TaxID=409849 RepID=UPI002436CCD1|nr:uncharacterized protein C19orf44 homolog isoform X2 [Periophthalmus magnuspinnatus]
MWKQSGRSSALERAQAVLSSRRGRAAPVAAAPRVSHQGAVRPPPAKMSSELLSDLSDNESSLSLGPEQVNRAGATPVPNQTGDGGPEVARPLTPLDSCAIRFLKRPSTAAQDQPKERAVPSSLRGSQAAVLNRLAQIENRFGKSLHTTGSSRAGKTAVQEFTEEQGVLPSTDQPSMDQPSMDQPSMDQPSIDQPSMDQPRRFVKSRPPGAHGRRSEDSNSRRQLHTETPPPPPCTVLYPPPTSLRNTLTVQTQSSLSTPSMSPSPPCMPPSAPSLSPSSHSLSSVGSASSAGGNVCSLEELFPLKAASEDAHSDSSDSSEHFRPKLIDLDELAPSALLLEEHPSAQEPELQEEPQEEVPDEVDVPDKVEVVDQVEEVEEVLEEDYTSEFESVFQTESLSEHFQGGGRPQSPYSKSSYSDTFSRATPSEPCTSEPPPHSHAPLLHGHAPLPHSYFSLPQPDMTSANAFRDTVGQASHVPATGCSSCPSLELLMQSLRQQLTLTSHFISSSQEHQARVLQGLGPPNYRYTTLQDTLKYISTLRASRPHSDQQTARR